MTKNLFNNIISQFGKLKKKKHSCRFVTRFLFLLVPVLRGLVVVHDPTAPVSFLLLCRHTSCKVQHERICIRQRWVVGSHVSESEKINGAQRPSSVRLHTRARYVFRHFQRVVYVRSINTISAFSHTAPLRDPSFRALDKTKFPLARASENFLNGAMIE